jgi:Ca2+-binding EF-hand superfamily protein
MWGWGHFVHQLDTDTNGVVSKDEFSQFMDKTFKRLDINRNGVLERNELRPLYAGRWGRIHTPAGQ